MKIANSLKALMLAAWFVVGCDLPDADSEQSSDPAAEAEATDQALRPRPNTGATETCMQECKRVRCTDGTIRNCDAYCTTYCYFKDILKVDAAATAAVNAR